MARKLEVEIVGDTKSLQAALGKASVETETFGSKVAKAGKIAAIAGGAAGIGALVFGLKASIETSIEHQKALAQTEAALKSTGGAAGVTAKDVTTLADKIEKMSGVDDLAVQRGENLLLTFTNIRNEVGKGNDIFDQATMAITDMSVALGQDMKSSAIQLGKALNDPVKGMTALRRVGVSFTADQVELVKTLVDSGRTLDAQKLILRELTKEFGGSAKAAGETFPGKLKILQARLDDIAQKIGDKLLPYLMKIADWVLDNWPTIGRVFETALNVIQFAFDSVIAPIKVFWNLLHGDWSGAWNAIKAPMQDLANLITGPFMAAWSGLSSAIGSAIGDLGGVIDDNVITPITNALTGFASDVGTTASTVGTAIMDAIAGGVTAAWSTLSNAVTGLGGKIGGLASGAWNEVVSLGRALLGKIASGLTAAWTVLQTAVTNLGGKIGSMASQAWDAVVGLGRALLGKIASGLTAAWNTLSTAVTNLGGKIGNMAGDAWTAVVNLGGALLGKIASGLTAAWETLKTAVINLGGKIGNLASLAWEAVVNLGKALGRKIASGLRWLVDQIKIPGFTVSIPYPEVSLSWGHIDTPFGSIPYPDGIDIGVGWYSKTLPGFDPLPGIPEFAKGGIVRKPTLAMIGEAGPEAVVPLSRASGMGYGGTQVYQIVLDRKVLSEAIRDELGRLRFRNGTYAIG